MKKFHAIFIFMLISLAFIWGGEDRQEEFFEAIDKQIRQIESELRTVKTLDEKGTLTKRKAELIFEKSRYASDYLYVAIEVMEEARRLFERSGNDVLLSLTLTALGNLNQHLKRLYKAYEFYKSAAKLAENKNIYAYFSAEMNRLTTCCRGIADKDPQFLIRGMVLKEINGDLCCIEGFEKLIEKAKKAGKIDLEFIAYRAYYGIASYVMEKEGSELKTEIKDRAAELAFRLLSEKKQSKYDRIAAKTLVDRCIEILNSRSIIESKRAIEWLSKNIKRIAQLKDPELVYSALTVLGTLEGRLHINMEDAAIKLELALLMGVELGKAMDENFFILPKLINLYNDLGEFDKSENSLLQLIEILKKEKYEEECLMYELLGTTLDKKGNYIESLNAYSKAMKLADSKKGFYEKAQVRYNMSFPYKNIGELDKARDLLIESLNLYGKQLEAEFGFKEQHPMPTLKENMHYHIRKDAELLESMGKMKENHISYNLHNIFNQIWNCYSELAKISIQEQNFKEARENYIRAAKWYQRATLTHFYGGPIVRGDPGATIGLCKLALKRNDLKEAERYLRYYKDRQQKNDTMFNQPFSKVEILTLEGEFFYKKGELDKAGKRLEMALQLTQKYGLDIEKVKVLKMIAFLQAAQEKQSQAFATFLDVLQLENKIWRYVMFSASLQAKLNFLQEQNEVFEAFLSLIAKYFIDDPKKVGDGFFFLQKRKGIIFESETNVLEALGKSLDNKDKQELKRLSHLKAEIARLMLGKSNLPPGLVQKRVGKYLEEASRIEEELLRRVSYLADFFLADTPKPMALAKRLPDRSGLVEFICIKDYDFKKRNWTGKRRYLTFLLNKSGKTNCIDLGDADVIDELARKLNFSLSRDSVQYRRGIKVLNTANEIKTEGLLSQLYSKIWRPIEGKSGNTATVLIGPDGVLNLVPFAALKASNGQFLIEKYNIGYVSVGKDLQTGVTPRPFTLDLLLVANPDFDFNKHKKEQERGTIDRHFCNYGIRSSLSTGIFHPLRGTEVEAREIAVLFKKHKTKILTGKRATEAEVRNAINVKILHLASHGFFLEPGSKKKGSRKRGILENPLLRSGIALAGANQAFSAEGQDDGILTAYEVTGLNFRSTDLVTLSACETGRGEIRTGEGVFGLRRAFALAGAKNLMMSLWMVKDDITAEHMKDFYNLYIEGQTPLTALKNAQLKMIEKLRKTRNDAPPALWAPFILQIKHPVDSLN